MSISSKLRNEQSMDMYIITYAMVRIQELRAQVWGRDVYLSCLEGGVSGPSFYTMIWSLSLISGIEYNKQGTCKTHGGILSFLPLWRQHHQPGSYSSDSRSS
ncbi:UNVERIFIED_CONTAM: hypothetical protein K2H54_020866 [Gekko kuhli]